MTIIACRDMNGIIEIASDSAIHSNGLVYYMNKLVRVRDTIFGLSGMTRDRELLQQFLIANPIKKVHKKDSMITTIYNYWFKYVDFHKKYLKQEEIESSEIILIHEFHVFQILALCITEIPPGEACATGTGRTIALCSMLNNRGPLLAAKDACVLNAYCRPPIHKYAINKETGVIEYFKHDFAL